MSLEMAHKVILPPKKNYIPQFLKQRDINSYFSSALLLSRGFMRARRCNLPQQNPSKYSPSKIQ
jgi:hypothetical protein